MKVFLKKKKNKQRQYARERYACKIFLKKKKKTKSVNIVANAIKISLSMKNFLRLNKFRKKCSRMRKNKDQQDFI